MRYKHQHVIINESADILPIDFSDGFPQWPITGLDQGECGESVENVQN